MKKKLLAGLATGAFWACMVGMANATIIIDNSVSGTITNDFESLATGAVSGLINQDGATYGELFTGQILSTVGGFDSLSGMPTAALNLEANANIDDNIGVISYYGSNVMYGDLSATIGEGALSILLDNQTDIFGFDVVGTNGGALSIDFWGDDGSALGTFSISSLTDSFYGFSVDSGSLIAGVSITNTDFAGIAYDNFTFNSEPGNPVPEPATMLLFGTGLAGLVGSRVRRKKKA